MLLFQVRNWESHQLEVCRYIRLSLHSRLVSAFFDSCLWPSKALAQRKSESHIAIHIVLSRQLLKSSLFDLFAGQTALLTFSHQCLGVEAETSIKNREQVKLPLPSAMQMDYTSSLGELR